MNSQVKRVVVIGGAGAMGHVVVRDLLDNPELEVVIADYDREKADALADTLNSKLKTTRVRGDFTDITNKPVMVKGLKNAACVINSTPYYHNVNVMEAALEAGCHYVDLGGLFHVSKEQLKLHERFVEKGLTAVIGMGAAPGMTNIMAAKAQENMESVEAIDIYVGSIDNTKSSHPFLPPYSIETLIDEYTMPPMVFDGDYKEMPPLSGAVIVDFPEPVGKQEAIYTLHSEVLTLPQTYKEKGIKNCTFRLGLPLEFHEKIKFLMSLGFGSREKLNTREGDFTPRKILAAMLSSFPTPESEPDDCEVVRVDVRGMMDGKPTLCRLETTVYSVKRWHEGISCGALDTGVPPSIVAQMLVADEIISTGVLAPEVAVPAGAFFAELARRDIHMKRITQEDLSQA
ncbi:MAG: saccharopine dehydrogenase NADP-binding domain-containing protein [Candidatus Melainabacteria bacterium]|nr:saccharopine dehydrogenase NADP-binding domain-containing protein [Candidatus Melainabacteria bacterium]